MGESFWEERFRSSLLISDCRIFTGDGKQMLTHKIFLASKSDFLKTILIDIPAGCETALILPDFSVREVQIFLEELFTTNIQLTRSILWHMLVNGGIVVDKEYETEKNDIENVASYSDEIDNYAVKEEETRYGENDADNKKLTKKEFDHHMVDNDHDEKNKCYSDHNDTDADTEQFRRKESEDHLVDTYENIPHDFIADSVNKVQKKQILFQQAIKSYLR